MLPDVPCFSAAALIVVEPQYCVQLLAHATKLKEHANALYAAQRLSFAVKKYDRAVALLKRHRGVDSEEQAAALAALQTTLLSNLAAAHMAQQVCA